MKITRRQLIKIIQEAMYNPRSKRDSEIAKLDQELRYKIEDMIDARADNLANELVHSLRGYKPSPEYPDATSYTEEIGQFDRKMKERSLQHVENSLSPKDRELRKLMIDHLFDPQGDYRIPLDSLTNVNTTAPGGFFKMHFMMWEELFPDDIIFHEMKDYRESAERVFNSLGGSHYAGDGDTLVPLPGLSQQDQVYYNQVILKILNNDPEFV